MPIQNIDNNYHFVNMQNDVQNMSINAPGTNAEERALDYLHDVLAAPEKAIAEANSEKSAIKTYVQLTKIFFSLYIVKRHSNILQGVFSEKLRTK